MTVPLLPAHVSSPACGCTCRPPNQKQKAGGQAGGRSGRATHVGADRVAGAGRVGDGKGVGEHFDGGRREAGAQHLVQAVAVKVLRQAVQRDAPAPARRLLHHRRREVLKQAWGQGLGEGSADKGRWRGGVAPHANASRRTHLGVGGGDPPPRQQACRGPHRAHLQRHFVGDAGGIAELRQKLRPLVAHQRTGRRVRRARGKGGGGRSRRRRRYSLCRVLLVLWQRHEFVLLPLQHRLLGDDGPRGAAPWRGEPAWDRGRAAAPGPTAGAPRHGAQAGLLRAQLLALGMLVVRTAHRRRRRRADQGLQQRVGPPAPRERHGSGRCHPRRRRRWKPCLALSGPAAYAGASVTGVRTRPVGKRHERGAQAGRAGRRAERRFGAALPLPPPARPTSTVARMMAVWLLRLKQGHACRVDPGLEPFGRGRVRIRKQEGSRFPLANKRCSLLDTAPWAPVPPAAGAPWCPQSADSEKQTWVVPHSDPDTTVCRSALVASAADSVKQAGPSPAPAPPLLGRSPRRETVAATS